MTFHLLQLSNFSLSYASIICTRYTCEKFKTLLKLAVSNAFILVVKKINWQRKRLPTLDFSLLSTTLKPNKIESTLQLLTAFDRLSLCRSTFFQCMKKIGSLYLSTNFQLSVNSIYNSKMEREIA